MKTGKVKIDIYGVTVHVAFADNLMDALDYYKITGISEEEVFGCEAIVPELMAIKAPSYKDYYCFLMPNTGPHIVAHESLHLAVRILAHRGIFITCRDGVVDDEACAYLLGYLTKKILEIQKK